MARAEQTTTTGKRVVLSTRVQLSAVVCGVLVALAALVVFLYFLPSQATHTSNRDFGYVYSGAKSSSVEFSTSSASTDAMLLFGSSELSTPAKTVPQVAGQVFGKNDYGFGLNFVGEAFDQSLWHAIAAGAYSDYTSNRKVAIIASLAWFNDGGVDDETFGLRFSYSLYRAFCANPSISDESKQYVAKRLAEQGIDDATIQAGLRTTPLDCVNDAVYSALDDIKLRQDLKAVREKGIERDEETAATGEPDWDALMEQAYVDAKALSTNNDMGIDDAFYTENLDGQMERLKGSRADETYTDTPEYDDLTFFLKVCREVGFEPLVIISPVHGDFHDWEGISADTRNGCRDRVVDICEKAGVEYLNLGDKDYEKYFVHDIVHYGGPGWVTLEEALYEFAHEE